MTLLSFLTSVHIGALVNRRDFGTSSGLGFVISTSNVFSLTKEHSHHDECTARDAMHVSGVGLLRGAPQPKPFKSQGNQIPLSMGSTLVICEDR